MAVIQHLQVLADCGLVRSEKVGRVRTCRIDPAGLDILDRWSRARRSLWERRLDQLGRSLAGRGVSASDRDQGERHAAAL